MSDAKLNAELGQEERRIKHELENWLPRAGDELFVSTPNSVVVDCTGFTVPGEERSPIGRHDLYSSGYLLAADRLVESLQGLPQEDALLYPILSLYQHHIELELKGSISLFLNWLHRGTAEEREKLFNYLTREHSIYDLWNKLKGLAPTVVNQMGQATTKAFESLLEEVNKHPSFDQAARYARYRDGSQTLRGLNEVDLDNLKTQFHKMSHYLGAIAEGIHQEIDPE